MDRDSITLITTVDSMHTLIPSHRNGCLRRVWYCKEQAWNKEGTIELRSIACDKLSLHIGIIKSLTEITISSFHEDLLEGNIQTMSGDLGEGG